jgi:hypothetical protein
MERAPQRVAQDAHHPVLEHENPRQHAIVALVLPQ